MLAYVFWHWPLRDTEQEGYESSLFDFHRSLVERKPDGFHESYVFRLKETPWISNSAGPVYEDWYLVDDFHALGLLNEGAVTGVSRAPHHGVAQKADGGAAGVYRLRAGQPALSRARHAVWFSKPRGLPYDDFYCGIPSPALEAGGGLWERQMVLGPAAECCLLTTEEIVVPRALGTRLVSVELVWLDA
jgi:hypothetical protein